MAQFGRLHFHLNRRNLAIRQKGFICLDETNVRIRLSLSVPPLADKLVVTGCVLMNDKHCAADTKIELIASLWNRNLSCAEPMCVARKATTLECQTFNIHAFSADKVRQYNGHVIITAKLLSIVEIKEDDEADSDEQRVGIAVEEDLVVPIELAGNYAPSDHEVERFLGALSSPLLLLLSLSTCLSLFLSLPLAREIIGMPELQHMSSENKRRYAVSRIQGELLTAMWTYCNDQTPK